MSYYFAKTIDAAFAEAIERVTAALAKKGFGILTTIDVQATMKSRLGVDLRPYTILGACNPHFAWRALQLEEKFGTMLPCNVAVIDTAPGKVEVAAIDPLAMTRLVSNDRLDRVANSVADALREIVETL